MSDEAPAPVSGTASADIWTRRFPAVVAAVCTAAALVRLVAVLALPRIGRVGVGGDGWYYISSAKAFADGHGFSFYSVDDMIVPDVLHPPLWVGFLGTVYAVGGDTVERMGLAAGALGVVTVALVAFAGRRILSARAGVLAGAIVAVSPAFWVYERNLNAEAITYPLIAAVILAVYRYRDQPSLRRCLVLAAALGLLALARTEQLLIIAVVFVPLVLATPDLSWRARVGRVALAGALVLALLAPWTVYNLGRFDRPVLLSAGSGNAMLAGACDATFSGDLLGGYAVGCVIQRPDLFEDADRTVEDAGQRAAALDYTLDHLDRLPVVVLAREGRSWSVYRPAQQVDIHAEAVAVRPAVIWVQVVSFWLLLPLAVAGALLLRRRRIPVYPLLAFPAVAVVSTAITFGDIRYRAPAEISVVLLASFAVDIALAGRSRRNADELTGGRAPATSRSR